MNRKSGENRLNELFEAYSRRKTAIIIKIAVIPVIPFRQMPYIYIITIKNLVFYEYPLSFDTGVPLLMNNKRGRHITREYE